MAGIKVEFREQLAQITEYGGCRTCHGARQRSEIQQTYESVHNIDTTLALAGLRIGLDRRLVELATISGLRGPAPRYRASHCMALRFPENPEACRVPRPEENPDPGDGEFAESLDLEELMT